MNAIFLDGPTMRYRTVILSITVATVLAPSGRGATALDDIDVRAGCEPNPALVGPCFTVEGRAVLANGTPGFRILQKGTKRVLGVLPAESEIVPTCLAKAVVPDSEVSGEFIVCPFSVEKRGHMQMVCVQAVGEFLVRRWSVEQGAYISSRPRPGCTLPSGGSK
jgi:hypothetical protein